MKSKENLIRILVFTFFALSLFSFLEIHSTLTAGFHFVDNHEIVQINQDVKDAHGEILPVVKRWVSNDLGGRFRPTYIIDNVLVYSFFKNNFHYISIYHALIITLIAFFLFLSVRKIGFSLFESVVFPMLIFIGDQSAIFWRLGPNESIGMWYFSITLLFIAYVIKSLKHQTIYRILFAIFGFLMMLSKESFLLITPAILFTYIILAADNFESGNLLDSVKKKLPEVVILSAIFITCILFIYLKVNTENLGYAGIKGVDFNMYMKALLTIFKKDLIGISATILYIISFTSTILTSQKRRIRSHIYVAVITLLIIIPQVFLYGKSGIFERYFIPSVIAWAILFIFSFHNLHSLIKNSTAPKFEIYFKGMRLLILVVLFIPKIISINNNAENFTAECHEVNSVLSLLTQNVDSTGTVLFIAEPTTDFERTISFRRFLGGISQITKIYTYPIQKLNTDEFEKSLIRDFSWVMGGEQNHFNKLQNKADVQFIVCFPYWSQKADSILCNCGYAPANFTKLKVGQYMIYALKRVGSSTIEAFKSETVLPVKDKNAVYNETAFYPINRILKGDSITITIHTASGITDPMVAYIILLDVANPENILIHTQITGNKDIVISKMAASNIKKPWIIYRNWGNKVPIPAAEISYQVKPNNLIELAVR